MVRVMCLSLSVATAVLAAAAVGHAAERPGDLDKELGRFVGDRIEGLDVGSDRRIVAAGRSQAYPLFHPWVRAYLPDGSPDPGFGGDGTVDLTDDRRRIAGTLVQPDGRIVVAHAGGGEYEPGPHLVRRLNADGTPDETFGNGGAIQPDVGTRLTDIALQPDGGLIVVGARTDASLSNVGIVVARYLPSGLLDSGFGSNGMTELAAGPIHSLAEVAVQPGSGVVLTLQNADGLAIARLSPDGRLDDSFGGGGLAPVELGRPGWRRFVRRSGWPGPRAVVLADGRIRLPVSFDPPRQKEYRMAVVGLTKNGHPDRGFGLRGLARGPRSELPGGDSAETAIADQSGGIIVAGSLWDGGEFAFDTSALMRRFRADGSVDRSFGDGGMVRGRLPPSGYPVFQQELAFLDDDTLVAAEHTFDGKYGFWGPALLRTLHAGYDVDPPSISIGVRSCRSVGVHITDLSRMHRVLVRADHRVVRRTRRTRFRVQLRRGARRVSVVATDLAENVSRERVRLPRC